MATQETIFYQQDPVLVTNARIVLGGQTYVLRNVTSVGGAKVPPNRGTGRTIALVSLVVALCISFASGGGSGNDPFGVGILVIPAFIGIIAGLVMSFSVKPRFAVKLVSGSGEVNGYISADKNEVEKIVNAINQAIIARG